jgi:plastocyanin
VESTGKFKSKVMDTDEDYTKTFDAAGEVTYFCGLHPHMKAKIIVKPTS